MSNDLRALYRLQYLHGLMLGKRNEDPSDIDRELLRLLKEVDRRDGPGAGEQMLLELARPWMKVHLPWLEEHLPMEGDTHGD